MSNSLLDIIKKASQGAEKAADPCDVLYGKVTNINPLKITLEQKMILTKKFLVLTKNVIDYETFITINNDKRKITIHNALEENDTVVLLQKRGGQEFIVIDKI